MTNLKIAIKNLRTLKEEFKNDPKITKEQSEIAIRLADSIIRSHEILLRLNEYEEEKFYFGYLLIQAQRIEKTIKSVILILNKKRTEDGTSVLLSEDDLNKPLGVLINNLEKYIKSDFLFKELRNFKEFRDKMIHRINDDYSISLYDMENSIPFEYSINTINRLQALLLKIYDIPEIFPQVKALKDILEEYDLEDVEIKIL